MYMLASVLCGLHRSAISSTFPSLEQEPQRVYHARVRSDLDFATKNYNATAAIFAAREGHLNCLNILREAGADMDIERSDGKTAMQIHREQVRAQMANVMMRSMTKSGQGFKV